MERRYPRLQTLERRAYSALSDRVCSSWATLTGKPVGEARGSVKISTWPPSTYASSVRLSPVSRPDFRHSPKAVPTCTPAPPASRAWRRRRGSAYPPASQKGRPRALILSRSTSSRGPYSRWPRPSSCKWRRGGALWPPAVGPSMTKPSTWPVAILARARVTEAMMARKYGRRKGGATRRGRAGAGQSGRGNPLRQGRFPHVT